MGRYPYCFALVLLLLPHLQGQQIPKAVLDGDVVNTVTNAPIAGARVKLSTSSAFPDEPLYTKADAQGHFRFADLKPGSYALSVESPGFLKSASNHVDLTIPGPNTGCECGGTVSAGATGRSPAATFVRSTDPDGTLHSRAAVLLTPQAVIAGKVTDPYGLPMADCQVELLVPVTYRPPGAIRPAGPGPDVSQRDSVEVDDKGEFRFAALEPGRYYLVADKGGWRQAWEETYRMTYYSGATASEFAKPLDLAAGQQVRADIQIVRKGGVRIAGKILRPQSESATDAVANTNITLAPQRNALMNSNPPSTNGLDHFEFSEVLPGKYTLMAVAYRISTDPADLGLKRVLGLMRDFEVGDHDMLDLDLTMQPLPDLAGVVTFRDGCKPIPVQIRLYGFSPLGGSGEAQTATDGNFVFRGPGPGRFTVDVTGVSAPGMLVPVDSIRLGESDVLKNGLDLPYAGNDRLRIGIGCDFRSAQ